MTFSKSVICVTVLCAAPVVTLRAQDSSGNRRLAELVRELEGERFQEVMEELTAVGGAAVPHLVGYVKGAGEIDIGHIRAVRVLGRMGEAAVPAIPDLLDLLPETTLRNSLGVALGRIGPYAQDRGPEIRSALVATMFNTPTSRPDSFVIGMAGDPVLEETYGRTLVDPKGSTTAITDALQDENPYARAYAAELLFTRGEVNETMIAALRTAVTEPHPKEFLCETAEGRARRMPIDLDRRIHRLAARALVHLAPEDPRSLPGHRVILSTIDPTDRLAAVMALGHLGSAAAPAVPQLMSLLEADLPGIRREAVTALGMIGPGAADAIPVLEQLTGSSDLQIAERARSALRQIRR